MKVLKITFLVVFLLLTPKISTAGNPTSMYYDGFPVIWNTETPIRYLVDKGGLGRLNYEQSLALVQQAISTWTAINDVSYTFEYVGETTENITKENFANVFSDNPDSHYIIFVFDDTGEINSTPGVTSMYLKQGFYFRGSVIINNLYINGDDSDLKDFSLNDMLAVLTHEMGHVLGLDHSVMNFSIYEKVYFSILDRSYLRYIPTMVPYIIPGTGEHQNNLHPDDIATALWLYSDVEMDSLQGNIYDKSAAAQYSLVVTARNKENPLCLAYSQVSGITCTPKQDDYWAIQCESDNDKGLFSIPVLEKGAYSIDVSELGWLFYTSVTRFSYTIMPPLDIAGGTEFYNLNDSADENFDTFDFVSVSGETSGIDIYLSEDFAPENRLKDIDHQFFLDNNLFSNTESSYCPLDNYIDVASLIGAEELVADGQEEVPFFSTDSTDPENTENSFMPQDTETPDETTLDSENPTLPQDTSAPDETIIDFGSETQSMDDDVTETQPEENISPTTSNAGSSAGCSLSDTQPRKNTSLYLPLVILVIFLMMRIKPASFRWPPETDKSLHLF